MRKEDKTSDWIILIVLILLFCISIFYVNAYGTLKNQMNKKQFNSYDNLPVGVYWNLDDTRVTIELNTLDLNQLKIAKSVEAYLYQRNHPETQLCRINKPA